MASFTERHEYKLEIIPPHNIIQCRRADIVEKDGVEVGRTYHRHVRVPGDDVSEDCAELQAVGKRALLVPLKIGNGEQEANAAELLSSGQAELISNSEFTPEWLKQNIGRLLMNSEALNPPKPRRAAEKIGEKALDLIRVSA